ncbi:MAG: hypothetical protein IJD35_02370 [Clostridia bacterium]|nr:hypothetical protein [Clostridia bacterium]
MKKIIVTLAVLLLLVASLAVMTACGGTTETTAATTTTEAPVTTEAPLPEGYTLYDNGDISFAYPEGFVKQDGSTVILADMTTGNNITVVYEAKTDMYETLDNNGYKTMFKPIFEAMDMTVTNYAVEQIAKNATGISLTKITHTASTQGKTMEQTMLITTVGNKTYTVTVTEVVHNDAFVNNVLNSLGLSK